MQTPRSEKELAKLLLGDPDLRREVHKIVGEHDRSIEKQLLNSVREAARRSQISLRMLDHEAATAGLLRYYRDIKAAGKFVRLW